MKWKQVYSWLSRRQIRYFAFVAIKVYWFDAWSLLECVVKDVAPFPCSPFWRQRENPTWSQTSSGKYSGKSNQNQFNWNWATLFQRRPSCPCLLSHALAGSSRPSATTYVPGYCIFRTDCAVMKELRLPSLQYSKKECRNTCQTEFYRTGLLSAQLTCTWQPTATMSFQLDSQTTDARHFCALATWSKRALQKKSYAGKSKNGFIWCLKARNPFTCIKG